MRVQYLDHCAKLAGAELALLRTVGGARLTTPSVVLLEHGPLVHALEQVKVPTCVIESNGGNSVVTDISRKSVGRSAMRAIPAAFVLARRIRGENADAGPAVVVSNSMKAHVLLALSRMVGRSEAKHIAYIRDRVVSEHMSWLGVQLIRICVLLSADGVIANSKSTLTSLPRWTVRRKSVAVIPSPIELPSENSIRPSRAQGGSNVYGVIGRITPWKGQDLALRAFAQAFRGSEVRLEFAGDALFGEKEYLESLRRLAVQLGIDSQVSWLGHVDDIYERLGRWRGVVHSSVIPEPFGQVVVQGMASGAVVIAADEGGPAETVRDRVNGVLYEARSVESLAQALLEVENADDEWVTALGRAAVRDSAQYSVSNVVERIEKFARHVGGRS